MPVIDLLNRNILEAPFYLGVVILTAVIFLSSFRQPFLKRHIKRIFLYSAGLTFAYLIYITFLQFRAFYEDLLSTILGTWGGLIWFFGYVRLHFWNTYLISLPIALLFALIAYYFNRKYKERFFEREEPFMAALGILLVGYPAFFFYIVLVLILPSIASVIFMKRGERMPLYYFWIPTALVVLLVVHFWAGRQEWWASFRF